MRIERINNEILIRLSTSTDITVLQRLLDFLNFTEITKESKANQEEIDALSKDIKSDWWKKNKDKFLK
jgi:hypothetical protein